MILFSVLHEVGGSIFKNNYSPSSNWPFSTTYSEILRGIKIFFFNKKMQDCIEKGDLWLKIPKSLNMPICNVKNFKPTQ